MSIPQLHDGLESILGRTVFFEDMGFWNSVITDVTAEGNDNELAKRNYNSLRGRYVVSIHCANTFSHKPTN
jgi:hypothetical protein